VRPWGLVILGIGNPIKRDDSVGLYIAERLRSAIGARPSSHVSIRSAEARPELALSKLDLRASKLLILDAAEMARPAGTVALVGLNDTRYGFFATHNLPLRLHPDLKKNGESVFLLGVQPDDLSIGEGLSDSVRSAADGVVDYLAPRLTRRSDCN
jgi:hydrogenase 3 maturation protease